MECDLTLPEGDTPEEEVKHSATPFGDMLDKSCAYFMAIGVPYDEFWHGDYTKLKYYEQAYKIEVKLKNQDLWLQGMYFYDAVSTALHNVFAGRGKPPKNYTDKPYRLFELSEEEKEQEKKEMVKKFRDQLNSLCGRIEEKHKREQGRG